jgi:hypothetical protein
LLGWCRGQARDWPEGARPLAGGPAWRVCISWSNILHQTLCSALKQVLCMHPASAAALDSSRLESGRRQQQQRATSMLIHRRGDEILRDHLRTGSHDLRCSHCPSLLRSLAHETAWQTRLGQPACWARRVLRSLKEVRNLMTVCLRCYLCAISVIGLCILQA